MSPNEFDPLPVCFDQIRVVRQFNRRYELAIRQVDAALGDSGFSRLDLLVLRELGDCPDGANASWLIWRLGVEKAFVSRLFRSLRLHGYIDWQSVDFDRRIRNVTLTPEGWGVFRSLECRSDEVIRGQLGRLHSSDRQRLVDAMDAIGEILRP